MSLRAVKANAEVKTEASAKTTLIQIERGLKDDFTED